jgi:predicted rRNA methylase YqxC with S4 and FtsJ domains
MAKRSRLDTLLVAQGLFESREQAQRAIMAGEIKVGTRVAAKSSELHSADAEIHVKSRPQYVGRGGIKLEGALDFFHIETRDKVSQIVCCNVERRKFTRLMLGTISSRGRFATIRA